MLRRSRVMVERVKSVIVDLYDGKDMRDPAREKLIQTRKKLVDQWMTAADILDRQGEVTLAREVRTFANRLPQVLTDREQLAVDYVRHRQEQARTNSHGDRARERLPRERARYSDPCCIWGNALTQLRQHGQASAQASHCGP
jgi:hypothetical protein